MIDGDETIRTRPKTLIAIGVAVALGFGSWVLLRAQVEQNTKDIAGHTRKLEGIDEKLDAQRAILLEIRADQKAQARRSP